MAKMKVHELAKELDKQSKEIIAFLQEKGVEAKAGLQWTEGRIRGEGAEGHQEILQCGWGWRQREPGGSVVHTGFHP